MIGQKGIPAHAGGVERHVHDLSLELAGRGFEVLVYSREWYVKGRKAPKYVKQVITPSVNTKHLDTITHTLTSTIAAIREGVDVIHYHGVGPSLLSWIPRIFAPKVRVVNTFHSIDRKHKKWGFLARTALTIGEFSASRFAHKSIAVSETIQQYARDVFGGDLEYIPNAVNVVPKTRTSKILKQFGLEKKGYVLMVSRLIEHKGAHYLIDAWKTLKQVNPEITKGKKLVIVGDGHHTDDYVKSLHELANGNEDIVFTGFQSGANLKELFSHTELFVHPSDNEGLPIVVLEAMSYGLPMLVSDIVEHRNLIRNPEHRFKAGSVSSLAKNLKEFLTKSENSLNKIGTENKRVIKREFTWDVVTESVVEVYKGDAIASNTVAVVR